MNVIVSNNSFTKLTLNIQEVILLNLRFDLSVFSSISGRAVVCFSIFGVVIMLHVIANDCGEINNIM